MAKKAKKTSKKKTTAKKSPAKKKAQAKKTVVRKGSVKKAAVKKTGKKKVRRRRKRRTLTAEEIQHFRDLLLQKRAELIGDVSSIESEALKKSRLDAAGADVGRVLLWHKAPCADGKLRPQLVEPGAVEGADEEHGAAEVAVEAEGAFDLRALNEIHLVDTHDGGKADALGDDEVAVNEAGLVFGLSGGPPRRVGPAD